MKNSRARLAFVLGLAIVSASCGGGGSDPDPGPAASIAALDGNSQNAVVGETRAVLVRVLDANRTPVPGQVVRFRVSSGGGQVTGGSTISDAQGLARETWRLGTLAGAENTLVVALVDTVAGVEFAPITLRTSPVAGPAAMAIRITGTQEAGLNQIIPAPLVLRVTDSFGNPVAGVTVAWRQVSGNGQLISPISTTGADGQASASFRTGSTTGQVMIEAAVQGLNTVAFTILVLDILERLTSIAGRPFDVAITPAGVVLVSQLDFGQLTRFDLANPATHIQIPVGSLPSGLALNPAGTLAYVANQGSGTIGVVNLSTNSQIAAIPISGYPLDVAVMPNGSKVYATNTEATIFVINPATNTVTKSISVAGGPYSFAFMGDSIAFVAARNGGVIIELDTRTDAVRRNINVGGRPHDIALSTDLRTLYVANEAAQAVQFVDLASTAVTSVGVGTTFGLARSADGSKVYATATLADGNIVTIDATTRAILSTARAGGGPKRMAVHGTSVLIANEAGWINILR